VRLWVDDPAALGWMAPRGAAGVTVLHWPAAQTCPAPGDVLVEAFGCDPAPELIAAHAERARAGGQKPVWINLEYLSAEPYVERMHGLPSPVLAGPGTGLIKHFFYPGFTPATGGLLREAGLGVRQGRFDRAGWLRGQGVSWQGERLISLFCYEPPALKALLDGLAGTTAPVQLLVTAGRASAEVGRLLGKPLRAGEQVRVGDKLVVTPMALVPQPEFDHLLWSCDLNFVRGEDSLVRAIVGRQALCVAALPAARRRPSRQAGGIPRTSCSLRPTGRFSGSGTAAFPARCRHWTRRPGSRRHRVSRARLLAQDEPDQRPARLHRKKR
jgi:uncharacterized repeat protein (TIGR03837 family)